MLQQATRAVQLLLLLMLLLLLALAVPAEVSGYNLLHSPPARITTWKSGLGIAACPACTLLL
jgi:hypothetical protein